MAITGTQQTVTARDIEVVRFDQDVIVYQITGSNGPFRHAAKIDSAQDGLSKAAEHLQGFPAKMKDPF
jgi:hypothetical protein